MVFCHWPIWIQTHLRFTRTVLVYAKAPISAVNPRSLIHCREKRTYGCISYVGRRFITVTSRARMMSETEIPHSFQNLISWTGSLLALISNFRMKLYHWSKVDSSQFGWYCTVSSNRTQRCLTRNIIGWPLYLSKAKLD